MNCKRCAMPMMPVYNRKKGWQAVCVRCEAEEAMELAEGLPAVAARSAARGWNCYRLQEFDEALAYFTEAVKQGGDLPEYLWAKLLAQYGVKFCELGEGRYAVNFWRRELPSEPLSGNEEYRRLRRVAADDMEDLRCYTEAAADIDRGFRQIGEARGDACDVFLCFQNGDSEGPTPERAFCDELCDELTGRGLKVFYAPRSLSGKFTTDCEGYVCSALQQAKLLLIVASRREGVCAPDVEGEWRRFQRWSEGEDCRLMTCRIGDMAPGDFPPGLGRYPHELCAGSDELLRQSTIKRIGDEVEGRLGIVRERMRAEAKPAKPKPTEAAPAEANSQGAKQRREAPAEGGGAAAQGESGDGGSDGEAGARDGAEADPRAELERLEARAKEGDADAQCALGDRYFDGGLVERNFAVAVRWYRRAAEQGHADAQFKLGLCYDSGKGVEQNLMEAARWFRKAAEQGHAGAQCKFGNCYYEGRAVRKDYSEALRWFSRAAEQGHAEAECMMGVCYSNGRGVERDLPKALEYFRKAAEKGFARAQRALGVLYRDGAGVERDAEAADMWFHRAAQQYLRDAERGDALAQYGLAWCYEYGAGVPRDRAEALKWYYKAAEQGHIPARAELEASKWLGRR